MNQRRPRQAFGNSGKGLAAREDAARLANRSCFTYGLRSSIVLLDTIVLAAGAPSRTRNERFVAEIHGSTLGGVVCRSAAFD